MNLSRFFQDKVVVVTGSARGIGRETARQALVAGARVVVNGRDQGGLYQTAASLGFPDRVLAVAADVSTPAGAQAVVTQALAAWGRIDILINNAGLSMRGAFGELTTDTIRTMVEANLMTAVLTTRAALGALRESRGRVVFVSSLAAVRGFPGVSLYSASKMALTALHQSLAAEERPRGIGSTLVHLAFTENDPEKTVLGSDGRLFHHERKWSSTQTQAAQALLKAAVHGRGVVSIGTAGKVLSWAQRLVPGIVDLVLNQAGGTIHQVRRRPGS